MNAPLPALQPEGAYRQQQCQASARPPRRKGVVWAAGWMKGRVVVWHPKGAKP